MAEYRTIRMSFWNDPFIEEMSVSEKLLYIYLFTCPHTNNIGVLEVSRKKIAFETGIDLSDVTHGLAMLEANGKIVTDGPMIWLTKFIRHQTNTSPKMLAALKNIIEDIVSPKIREALRIEYPEIFGAEDTVSSPKEDGGHSIDTISIGRARGMDTLSTPYPSHIDTLPIPSGEREEEREREEEINISFAREREAPDADASAPQGGESVKEPYTLEFLDFWEIYPRKIAKDAAFKAWKTKKREKLLPGLDVLRQAIVAARDSPQWQQDAGRFIPHPATWLNQGRWKDEKSDISPGGGFRIPDWAKTGATA